MSIGNSHKIEKKILVSFRNDDPSARSIYSCEKEIIDIFRRFRVQQTIAFIPFVTSGSIHQKSKNINCIPLSSNEKLVELFKDYMEESGSEAALHGYSHNTNIYSITRRREYFEFRKLPLNKQIELISAGIEELKRCFSISPITFVPPWNRCDSNTIVACEKAGIKLMSADKYLNINNNIINIGCNASLETFNDTFEKAKNATSFVFINVLYHSPSLTDMQKIHLENILQSCSEDRDVEINTIKELAKKYLIYMNEFNNAGRTISELHNITNSVCGKAHIYLQAKRKFAENKLLENFHDYGNELYRTGEYEKCNELFETKIIRYCRKYVILGRLILFLIPLIILYAVSQYIEVNLEMIAIFIAAIIAFGYTIYWKTTSSESRKEVINATMIMLASNIFWAFIHLY